MIENSQAPELTEQSTIQEDLASAIPSRLTIADGADGVDGEIDTILSQEESKEPAASTTTAPQAQAARKNAG